MRPGEAARILDRLRRGYAAPGGDALLAQLREQLLGHYEEERQGGVVSRRWVEHQGFRPPLSALLRESPGAAAPPKPKEPEVVLSDEALEQIEQELFWSVREDGCETGGVMFGRAEGERVICERVSGPGPRAERSPSLLRLRAASIGTSEAPRKSGSGTATLAGPSRAGATASPGALPLSAAAARASGSTRASSSAPPRGIGTQPAGNAWVVRSGRIRAANLKGGL